jgi:CheY-like chemotaxis protein
MNKKMKRILLVEDTPSEMERAENLLRSKGLEVITAGRYDQGSSILSKYKAFGNNEDFPKEEKVDGVLTDLFLESNRPYGVVLALTAKEMGLPAVICTDSYHHDNDATEVMSRIASVAKIPYVESIPEEREKDWDKAYEELERLAKELV